MTYETDTESGDAQPLASQSENPHPDQNTVRAGELMKLTGVITY